mmetsp:Transcript_15704/g.43378  ORF Transcript_15704/g.43378 Transcript_15704/m.43378 type:complete len:230 (-) Transcript_15704:47-736(-)
MRHGHGSLQEIHQRAVVTPVQTKFVAILPRTSALQQSSSHDGQSQILLLARLADELLRCQKLAVLARRPTKKCAESGLFLAFRDAHLRQHHELRQFLIIAVLQQRVQRLRIDGLFVVHEHHAVGVGQGTFDVLALYDQLGVIGRCIGGRCVDAVQKASKALLNAGGANQTGIGTFARRDLGHQQRQLAGKSVDHRRKGVGDDGCVREDAVDEEDGSGHGTSRRRMADAR